MLTTKQLVHNYWTMKYTVLYQKEKQWYSVTVLELPWCISQWDTKQEATQNIGEAIELYLESIPDIAKMRVQKNKNISVWTVDIKYEAV